MAVVKYDPKEVQVIIDGAILTGFADGTFVTASREEERYEEYVGAHGEVTRSKNANPLGTITVTLKHTSPSNQLLGRLARRDALFPIRVVDRNDGSTVGGSDAWLVNPADYERGDETEEREWEIRVADYEQREG